MLDADAFVVILALLREGEASHVDLGKVVHGEVEIHDGVEFFFCADDVEGGSVCCIAVMEISDACQFVPRLGNLFGGSCADVDLNSALEGGFWN
jgi:hypothetical protein